ncbi:MAG TPA: hypothetical protein VFW77_02810 [Candidatus Saccharimonadales bacterium]|nr:hypothetical protein [Candidatus Saccharimonadales bacterium]
MSKNNGRSPAAAEAIGESLSMNGNGRVRAVGTFAVWRRQSTGWNRSYKVNSNFRRELGSESRVFDGPGRRFYLITPADGAIVLGNVGGKFGKIKHPLKRRVDSIDGSIGLRVSGFSLSRPNRDGNKTVSLKLAYEGEEEGPEEERESLLRSSRASELGLPGLAMAVEVATVPAENKRADVEPLIDEHMPIGMPLDFNRPVLTYTLAQPE